MERCMEHVWKHIVKAYKTLSVKRPTSQIPHKLFMFAKGRGGGGSGGSTAVEAIAEKLKQPWSAYKSSDSDDA